MFGGGSIEEELEGIPEGLPRGFVLRRFYRPGTQGTRPLPHAGLGVPLYVQFTSPIRRAADLICHYNVKVRLRLRFWFGAQEKRVRCLGPQVGQLLLKVTPYFC